MGIRVAARAVRSGPRHRRGGGCDDATPKASVRPRRRARPGRHPRPAAGVALLAASALLVRVIAGVATEAASPFLAGVVVAVAAFAAAAASQRRRGELVGGVRDRCVRRSGATAGELPRAAGPDLLRRVVRHTRPRPVGTVLAARVLREAEGRTVLGEDSMPAALVRLACVGLLAALVWLSWRRGASAVAGTLRALRGFLVDRLPPVWVSWLYAEKSDPPKVAEEPPPAWKVALRNIPLVGVAIVCALYAGRSELAEQYLKIGSNSTRAGSSSSYSWSADGWFGSRTPRSCSRWWRAPPALASTCPGLPRPRESPRHGPSRWRSRSSASRPSSHSAWRDGGNRRRRAYPAPARHRGRYRGDGADLVRGRGPRGAPRRPRALNRDVRRLRWPSNRSGSDRSDDSPTPCEGDPGGCAMAQRRLSVLLWLAIASPGLAPVPGGRDAAERRADRGGRPRGADLGDTGARSTRPRISTRWREPGSGSRRPTAPDAEPRRVEAMAAKLSAWRTSVSTRSNAPNPAYVPNPQAEDGTITLPARTAEVHGVMLRCGGLPQKDTLGYWVRADGMGPRGSSTRSRPGRISRSRASSGAGPGAGGRRWSSRSRAGPWGSPCP